MKRSVTGASVLAMVLALLLSIAAPRVTDVLASPEPVLGAAPRAPFATVYADKTRVVFDLPATPASVTAAVSAGGLLTVDYTGIALSGTLSLPVGSAEVDSAAATQVGSDPTTVRITLDLARYQRFRVMSLAPTADYCHRIVIDVYRRPGGPAGDGPPLICIDPGHGGRDPGAIGASGAHEADLNLSLGLALADNLRAAGLRVTMTRSTDIYVDLHLRATAANAAAANLFLAVHHNAFSDPAANGTETYYKGTSTVYPVEGKLFAEVVQRNLVSTLGLADRGAKTHWRTLVVLDETLMTQALVEIGFISNPAEEAKIISPAGRQAATWGVANGIREYLQWSTRVFTTEAPAPRDYTTHVTYSSLRGSDRFDTAVRISKAMFPEALPAGSGVVLAPGETFPEALCGAPLAAAYGGPVLLTPAIGLSNDAKAELQRLAPQSVFCVGLSPSVVDQVDAAMGDGVTVTAITGTDGSAYDMSYRVAKALEARVGDMSGATAVITRGDVYPDAIGVSPLACLKTWPILLTDGPTGSLHAAAANALSELGITSALKVGTYATLPAGVNGVGNLSGNDRYATNRNVAEWGKNNAGLLFAHLGVATGDKFPDALAAGPYLALEEGVLLLSPLYGPLPATIRAEIAANAEGVYHVSFIAMIEPVIGQVRALLP